VSVAEEQKTVHHQDTKDTKFGTRSFLKLFSFLPFVLFVPLRGEIGLK